MKISGKIGGLDVELDRPEPVEQDGVWYEAVEYRIAEKGERYCDMQYCWVQKYQPSQRPMWIMRPIPTPTPEQLKVIGMKLDGDAPRECTIESVVWGGLSSVRIAAHSSVAHLIGTYRWHLVKANPAKATGEREKHYACTGCEYAEWDIHIKCKTCCPEEGVEHRNWTPKQPAPVITSTCDGCTTPAILCPNGNDPKEQVQTCASKNLKWPMEKGVGDGEQARNDEGHTSKPDNYEGCNGCVHVARHFTDKICWDCQHDGDDIVPRKNYTPQPPKGEDAPLYERDFQDALEASDAAGRKPEQRLGDFIHDLHQRAVEERYNVEDIVIWIHHIAHLAVYKEPEVLINDPQSGIRAVTNRRGTK